MTASSPDLRTLLGEVGRFVPAALLGAHGWDRIADRVRDLPGLATVWRAGFEFRLSDPDPAADFIVALGRSGELFSYYRRRGQLARPRSGAASLGKLLERIQRSEPELRWLRGVMLEYDVAKTAPGERSAPGVFVGLHPGFRGGVRLGGRPAGAYLAETLNLAVGWDPEPGEGQMLDRVMSSIPAKADMIQVGAMPGRAPRLLRTTVIFAHADEIPRFLRDIGWPGSAVEVDTIRLRIAAAADAVFAVSLGMGSRDLEPRLGLEVYLRKGEGVLGNWTRTRGSDWGPVLARLEAEGWCLPQKARVLPGWPRFHLIAGRDGKGFLYFGLNHLKISFGGDRLTSKAYAGMRFSPPGPTPRASGR